MTAQLINFASERVARRATEDCADILSLIGGGVAIVAALTDNSDFVWELDRNQAEVLMAGLALALRGQSARIVQPTIREVPRRWQQFKSCLK